jgi:protein tyrosine phosphatase (PTP) superfamily phosphohydrolase (DUF442 family)
VPSITVPPGPTVPRGVTPVPPGSTSQVPPRTEPNWLPAEARETPRPGQGIPDPLLGTSPSTAPGVPKLYPPEVFEKSTPEPPLIEEKTRPGAPAFPEKKKSAFPAGIPQFAQGPSGVWGGLRASIEDGLDWLAANGYRTVLHLRAPGESGDADRKQVERLGMTYASIEVSPQTLTPEKLEQFTKLVRDVARQPLFVYDQDGSIAGPLWYLYFRKVENANDEVARVRADRLGLRADREGSHRLMWLAVQKYLQDNP